MYNEIVRNIIDDEELRQRTGIELIASENYVSDDVLEAMGSVLTNKYAEGYPGHRYYGGCENVDRIEELARESLKKLFDAEYVNVQPHSGSQANMAVYTACLNPGDTIMGLDLSHGGHLTHGSPVNFSGKLYKVVSYGVKKETGLVDYDEFEKMAHAYKPKLIVAGASAYSRDWEYERMRKVADEVGALLMVDMSHPAGLIAAGLLKNPVKYAHIVTSTTHKTLRGPRGGVILIGKDFKNPFGITGKNNELKMMSELIDSAIFPGIQGGPLEHVIAAKAVAFMEALTPEFKTYQEQVRMNAQFMANELAKLGYDIVSGGTNNHCFLVDLRKNFPDLTGKEAETILGKVAVTVNKNMVPFDTRSPFRTSGIRIGTPAITTRGLNEYDAIWIANIIHRALTNKDNEDELRTIRYEVEEKMVKYPLFKK